MKPLLLCIMDGFGNGEQNPARNAILAANTPNLDKLFAAYPLTQIGASGLDVGLPPGQMGSSEVGHDNIGAGRIVWQSLGRISKSILDGDFFTNPALLKAVRSAKEKGKALHLLGLMGNGGVHAFETHLWALLELCKREGLKKVWLHCFLDGRDVKPTSGADFVAEAIDKCNAIGVGKVATVCGRFYAMDRDNRWERVEKAYQMLVFGEGIQNPDPVAAIRASYEETDADGKSITDEFLLPTVCDPEGCIRPEDSVIFFNFRPDRARELTRVFVDPAFTGFERAYFPLTYTCMTVYDKTLPNVSIAYPPEVLQPPIFGEYISSLGLKQLRIAETEKYAHVTFFFNDGRETPYDGEDRILVPSPKVETYDLQPEMSAPEVCAKTVEAIESGKYDVIILNFANCDMVGHTGVFPAVVKAVETVDSCVGKVWAAVQAKDGAMLLTADHGNADEVYNAQDEVMTQHSTNPVPFAVFGYPCTLREGGKLGDIAPTMLEIMGLPQPEAMTGQSLILPA
ncbi:MAG: 2,3-bisphosphoglycerate-independent phosphoglycerate mutase [Oscillospiraceae bacterium]|jgi:2,3-bisphosphoglycerate-independent phosphoglycerate mutase|nr:2,3-bisphosphoglycerate-independent phosphoglycerate mutase [Oscillospiraceae bacterium]